MPAVATAEASLVGFVLADKYRVLRVIGKGGMGIVYEAEHLVLGKRVAIKLMLEKYFEDSEAKTRFKREAIAASKIGNPHIIDVSDIGELPDGRLYVVMELLNGRPLSDVLASLGTMPPYRAISIMRQVLRAVGAAHAKGIIHRDLKPDNIFLAEGGEQGDFIKLLDFGISKVLDPDEQIALTRLTTTGVVMGTPLYMAPEQAMGHSAVAAADIYACGVILYELLAGRTPFIGNTYAVLVAQLLTAPPEPLQNLRPGLPMSVVNAVHRALEKDPARRFASAEMFAASLPGDRTVSQIELAGTLDSGYAVARIPTGAHASHGKRHIGTWLAIGAALILGVATAGVLIATQTGKESKPAPQATLETPPQIAPIGLAASKPAQPPTPAPDPVTTGILKVSSQPTGAKVFVDGKDKGIAPLEITLATGKHDVRFELDGHEIFATTTEIETGNNRFTGTLVKAKKSSFSSTRPAVAKTPTPSPDKSLTVRNPGPVVGPQRPPVEMIEIKKQPVPEVKKPDEPKPGSGKGNPYLNATKNNPYSK